MTSSLDLSRYAFSGAEAAPIENLHALSADDRNRLVHAGIDVDDSTSSGAFMHLNHSGVHCQSRQEGLEILNIKDALARYDGLPQYYWKLLDPDKDAFTRAAHANLHGGYFIRARRGVRITAPVQSCLFIKGSGTGQNVHNIVVVEEGAELNILGGCATAHGTRDVAHLGMTEYFVERGGKLSFTMIHNWGEDAAVRPRSIGVMGEDSVFQNNYILLKPVANLQMYPTIILQGRRAVARFNSVILAHPGSHVDSGNRIQLDAPDTRAEIISRTLTTGGVIINRGFIGASAVPARGHLECKGLILGRGRIHAIPELDAAVDGVELSHEAAVGKIAQEEIEYLMARGLDEDEATATIVRGFLNVDIMGLPPALKAAIDEQLEVLNAKTVM
jgi:Fe-S cluster assembly scaffold protein SufB